MQTNLAKIDLSPLQDDMVFRAAYAYYIGLSANYISQIFFQSLEGGTRRKQLYTWLGANKGAGWTNGKIYAPLYKAIVPDVDTSKRQGYLDCMQADFAKMLERMLELNSDTAASMEAAGKRFFKRIAFYHCIPRGESAFISDLESLREKRNQLKDPEKPWTDDAQIISALGVLLLPKLHQHFLGEINSANARAKREGRNSLAQTTPVDLAFRAARKSRAEATERVFGTRKRPGYGGTNKSSHKKLKEMKKIREDQEMAKQAFMGQYQALYPDGGWPRYNYHGFRIRKAFIGDMTLNAITSLVKLPKGKIHFSRDIEPIFNTAMRINAVMARAFLKMQSADNQELKRLRGEEKMTKNNAEKELRTYACLGGERRKLASAVRHNTLFFMAPIINGQPVSSQQVFEVFLNGFAKPHFKNGAQSMEESAAHILTLLERQKYDWVFERAPKADNPFPPPKVIRRWTQANRDQYLNFNTYRIDRRQNIRQVFANWAKHVQDAKQKVRKEMRNSARDANTEEGS